jgi:hypothetical protein
MKRALIAFGAVLVLVACAEKAQTGGAIQPENGAFQGTGMPYVAQGWTAGDRNSWEQHLKTRAQMGQNDYARIN